MPDTHPELYQELLDKTKTLSIPSATIRQRLWHIQHDTAVVPTCGMCGNHVKWDPTTKKYREYCSIRCSNQFTNVIEHGNLSVDDRDLLKTATPQYIRTLRKVNNKLYSRLINTTSFLPTIASPIQRVWHIVHNTYTIPRCAVCQHPVKWDSKQSYYRLYCSAKCSATSPQTRSKFIETCQEKYGANHHQQQSIATTIGWLNDPVWLMDQHIKQRKSLTDIATELNVDTTTVSNYFKKYNLTYINVSSRSTEEKQLADYLGQFLNQSNLIQNTKTIIPPYELDIFIPSSKVAIEMCGGYWHSDQKKTRDYHTTKYKLCKQQGIKLLTVYDVEWNTKQPIVKSMILNRLHIGDITKVAARACAVIVPTSEQQRTFYNTNHIQGYCGSTYCRALTFQGEIVAMMSVIKYNDTYVLNRFATSLFSIVNGGFSKLLSDILTKLPACQLISFADLRWGDGAVYSAAGFAFDKMIPPSYNYFKYDTKYGQMFHRSLFQRKFLHKRLTHFDPTLTEFENCDNDGLYRVWDCGKHRYVLQHNGIIGE